MCRHLDGDSLPMPIDEQMPAMKPNMPGMTGHDPAGMAVQMDPAAMAEQVCAGEEVDLTFIDPTVAHHEAAVAMARAALAQATGDQIRAFAEYTAQGSQIEELQAIRAELTSETTPAATG